MEMVFDIEANILDQLIAPARIDKGQAKAAQEPGRQDRRGHRGRRRVRH
ncbi:MAG: hypothetical protein U5P41_04980 [Gammaproteobacteria bacterium]|nr:hypothetical protein [Gammaproteobacteria bacterium]